MCFPIDLSFVTKVKSFTKAIVVEISRPFEPSSSSLKIEWACISRGIESFFLKGNEPPKDSRCLFKYLISSESSEGL